MSEITAVQAFELGLQQILDAHARHSAVLADTARTVEAPRSRRVLYAAIKAYRKAETVLYHAAASKDGRI